MKYCALAALAFAHLATAATISSGTYSAVVFSPGTVGGFTGATFQNVVTTDFTIAFIGDNPTGDPFLPVRCNPNDPFANPCTINAGANYTATYTDVNQQGMTLVYNGSTYAIAAGGCGTCISVPWQLTLNYAPTASFNYGPVGASAPTVLYNVTGSLTVDSPSGVGFLINNDPLTGMALVTLRLANGPSPGSVALMQHATFVTPEPATFGLTALGLVAGYAVVRRKRAA